MAWFANAHHMSAGKEYGWLLMRSGDIYVTVPVNVLHCMQICILGDVSIRLALTLTWGASAAVALMSSNSAHRAGG